jgi:imidazolonepropionase-like amidohydrolase
LEIKTLYSGGNVFDGKGNLSTDKGILTDGSKILEVANIGTFEGFSGRQVDTSGGTLLPGLIDCHVHLVYGGEKEPSLELTKLRPGEIVMRVLDNALKALDGGITSLRDLGGKDGLELAVREAFETGQRSGPTIRAAGSAICITGGHGCRDGRIADGPVEVVKAVREQIHLGADVIKMMATGGVMTKGVRPEDAHYTMEELAAGFREGHRFGKPCAAHVQNITGALNAIRAGVDSIEHGVHLDD